MLTANLWVQARLVNGSLGKVIDIVYKSNEQPPSLPSFVVVEFLYYKGPLWDIGNTDRHGLTFTAISRVTSLSGLHISPAFCFSRYSRMQDNPFVQRRKQEQNLIAS